MNNDKIKYNILDTAYKKLENRYLQLSKQEYDNTDTKRIQELEELVKSQNITIIALTNIINKD